MSASSTLVTTLKAYAGLQALIGNGDTPETYRVYPLVMPQDATRPNVVYQVIAATRQNTIADAGGTGVERVLFQITAWADTHLAAENVMEQVRLALKADPVSYVPISMDHVYEPQTKLYGVRRDFAQWYR